ncbi:MAG: LptF/LptG family permease, partial [Candidatus Latescibacteria bacterium]|nr:LptF/LptG family permease [Candidatus Latescibacterota bacterium]
MKLLSRNILKEFSSYLWYVIIAFVVIFVLVDSVEHIDEFIDDKIAVGLIVLYYAFYLPYIVVLTLPVSMLLA